MTLKRRFFARPTCKHEGPMAHDVFYITCRDQKLGAEQMRELEWALSTELGDSLPAGW